MTVRLKLHDAGFHSDPFDLPPSDPCSPGLRNPESSRCRGVVSSGIGNRHASRRRSTSLCGLVATGHVRESPRPSSNFAFQFEQNGC